MTAHTGEGWFQRGTILGKPYKQHYKALKKIQISLIKKPDITASREDIQSNSMPPQVNIHKRDWQ